ncbi:MAG TPA: putative toxin-antitoxin system toxin component, PIN family, partial [Rhodothermia bacterium]|nr:putative toxin-antitoxin system toxin component, PIN family [Rhodothermia bacterium]
MRVFLDTNVLVSAFTTRGICADILTVILSEHELLIGESILEELPRVLRGKMRMAPQIIEEALIFLRQEGAVVTAESIPELRVIRDPDDRQIIAEALAGGADLVV